MVYRQKNTGEPDDYYVKDYLSGIGRKDLIKCVQIKRKLVKKQNLGIY